MRISDAHPFPGRDEFGTAISNTTNQVDTRCLLDFFVTVMENWCHTGDYKNNQ